jgi:hypothetical protein
MAASAAQIKDPAKRSAPVLAALKGTPAPKQVLLLGTLPAIGGKPALEKALEKTKDSDQSVREAAARVVVDWPDAEAAPAMLEIAHGTKDLKYKVLSIRGIVRVVPGSTMPDEQKLSILKDAMAAAGRPEEKKFVLGGLGSVRNQEALKIVAGYLDDKAFQKEAAAAAVTIACPAGPGDKGLLGKEVAAVMQKVIAIGDARLKKAATQQLKAAGGTK